MAGQILNVNSEMNKMKQHINTVSHCTAKIHEVSASSKLYKSNEMINILTIVATVYVLAAAFLSYNIVWLGVGAATAIITAFLLLRVKTPICNAACVIIVAMILSAILFFMFFYNFIPIIVTLLEWMVVIISNFRMKNQVWKISSSL